MTRILSAVVLVALVLASCGRNRGERVENYSYARLDEVVVTHIDLDLAVDFDRERLSGTAALDIDNRAGAEKLYLDTWDLRIEKVTLGDVGPETPWTLGDSLPLIGRPLIVDIKPETRRVTVHYHTGPDARGLQWLRPAQTRDGRYPFLYSQSQAILARSWVPCQDLPANRITYRARVRIPPELLALMSASNAKEKNATGEYRFEMPQPIPTYLLAIAVGNLEYRAVSDRCGVYAEPDIVDDALWEFIDMERMTQAAEKLYGPYRWEQFDVLVLPPSFPYGGMENPRLTFVTPILVAGDRSLVATIAHELAHSWSGNLVTNATWNDFWLNEGFTVYFEKRISEEIYGREITEMQAMLGRQRLEEEVAEVGADNLDTALYIPLEGRDPDEVLGTAPYQKGYLFLRLLEETFGRERFDRFLRDYFDTFAFQTMTTERFLEYLKAELFEGNPSRWTELGINEWAYEGGIPDNAPRATSRRFERVDRQAAAFFAGKDAGALNTEGWTSQEWVRFLKNFDQPLTLRQLEDLSGTFRFAERNGLIQRSWYLVAIDNEYKPAYPDVERYLSRVGRVWLIRPIYKALAETPDGREFARRVYRDARPGYHPVARSAIDAVLGWGEATP